VHAHARAHTHTHTHTCARTRFSNYDIANMTERERAGQLVQHQHECGTVSWWSTQDTTDQFVFTNGGLVFRM